MSPAPEGVSWWTNFPNNCTGSITAWAIWFAYNQKDRCVCINSNRFSAELWVLPRLGFGSNPVSDIHRKNLENLNQETIQFGIHENTSLDFTDNSGSGTVWVKGRYFQWRRVEESSCPGVKECTYFNVWLIGDRKWTVGTLALKTVVDAVWQMFCSSQTLFFPLFFPTYAPLTSLLRIMIYH